MPSSILLILTAQISVRPGVVPQSLHSMLGVATRIAQRMGIHNEASLADCTVFEAEMRRRLWWSLMLFDSRIGQLASSKTVTLDPTWDCKVPLNVTDSDLRPEMKEPPPSHSGCTETLFAVVRSEVADFVRYSAFHLDFTSPALKAIARQQHQDNPGAKGADFARLATTIQSKYLKSCDPDNPLHFMTTWTTQSYLAKCRLMDHHSKYSTSCVGWTPSQRDTANTHALTMLECDTKVMTSPLSARFRWFNHFYFPFLAYIHIVQDLQKRPHSETAAHAWEVMSDNYEAWFSTMTADGGDSPVLKLFAHIIIGAWEACEAATVRNGGTPMQLPRIVSSLKATLVRMSSDAQGATGEQQQPDLDMRLGSNDDFVMPLPPTAFSGQPQPNVMGFYDNRTMMGPDMFAGAYTQNQMDWAALGGWPGWGSF